MSPGGTADHLAPRALPSPPPPSLDPPSLLSSGAPGAGHRAAASQPVRVSKVQPRERRRALLHPAPHPVHRAPGGLGSWLVAVQWLLRVGVGGSGAVAAIPDDSHKLPLLPPHPHSASASANATRSHPCPPCAPHQLTPFPRPTRAPCHCQVLTSLAFMHALGLVHADLKPENILVKSYSRWVGWFVDCLADCFGRLAVGRSRGTGPLPLVPRGPNRPACCRCLMPHQTILTQAGASSSSRPGLLQLVTFYNI